MIKINYKKILLAAFIILAGKFSYSQQADNWEWLNPKPQGNTLYSVDFTDNNTGYSAGVYGTILKTINGGVSWSKQNSGTTEQFLSLSFVNANTGYAGGNNQVLKKTTDGGVTWNDLQLPSAPNFSVLDLKFTDVNTGYALGFFIFTTKIWKTTDGGQTWSTVTLDGNHYHKKLWFIDSNTGFAAGGSLGGEIMRSTDAGATWNTVYQSSYAISSIYFINSTTGFAGCEDGKIYKTVDAGTTWNVVGTPSSLDISSINFVDASTGFGFGDGSVYVKTTNGGDSWEEINMNSGSIRLYNDAQITPNGTIHAVGTYGTMIRSTDAGATFISQATVTEQTITDINFVNTTTGYAVGGFGSGDILKTTNAGNTWVSQVTSYTLPLYSISFTSEQTGYLAGSTRLLKTTNGGTNWFETYTNSNEIYTSIFFTSVNTGYAVGSYSRLLKTTNAGANWVVSVIPAAGSLISSLYFVDDNTGFAVGDNHTAFKTIDGGISWTTMNVPAGSSTFNNIFFSNSSTGYLATGGSIFKTTTGGDTWFTLNTPPGGFNKVQFRNNFGYAINGGGKIVKSTDAGNTWFTQPTVLDEGLYALYFNSDNYVYAGGLIGAMIKTIPTELQPTGISGNNGNIPKNFSLNQNYPNPFNPSTVIKYDLRTAGSVSLKVYNVIGQQVAVLMDGFQNAGSYSFNFNAANLPSGVYFYTIKTNDFTDTKKMLLVK